MLGGARRTTEDVRETQGFEITPMSSSENLSEELGGTRRSSAELGGCLEELGGAQGIWVDHAGR